MSSIVAALDTHTPFSYGEKGHPQYTWSHDMEEKIVQYFFQLTRSDKSVVRNTLSKKFIEILSEVKLSDKTQQGENYLLTLIVKLIAQTRDIVDGKGEYELSYMMVYELYSFYPELAEEIVREFVTHESGEHPFGSWKDIKYLCQYCAEQSGQSHPLIKFAVSISVKQINLDRAKFNTNTDRPINSEATQLSLISRWLPREKSKFGWLFKMIAEQCFNHFIVTAAERNNGQNLDIAKRKCYTHFRLVLSSMNKYLDTVQIKQCDKRWREIEHEKLTSITIRKQNNALRNISKGHQRSEDPDRIKCAENFKDFMGRVAEGKTIVKGKRVSMIDFVRDALSCDDAESQRLLNYQWNDSSKLTGKLPNMIAMVDVSGSMSCDNCIPLYSAVALGCRVAEKSLLGKRVLTFSETPSWINLESCSTFTEMVHKIKNGSWGFNTNFTKALRLILGAIEEARLLPEEVKDMVLTVFSDMQIDSCGNESPTQTMLDNIDRMYHEAGMRVHGRPYKRPHILFWNLRSTSGFPTLSSVTGCSMMSGASPSLLNLFCEKGMDVLEESTPLKMVIECLANKRYDRLELFCNEFIDKCMN